MVPNYTEFNLNKLKELSCDDEDAANFIKNPDSFRSFGQGLIELFKRKGYTKNPDRLEMSDYLFTKLRDIGSKIKKETVYSWFSDDHRPKVEAGYRQQIYEICFALHLTYEETKWFFQHVYYDRAFNCHTIDEAVFLYAFKNNLAYSEALSIIDTINQSSAKTPSLDIRPDYTKFIQDQVSEFQSTEELSEFLISNKNSFNSWNNSALNILNNLVNELIASEDAKEEIDTLKRTITRNQDHINKIDLKLINYEDCGLLMKELFYNATQNSNPATYILETISNKNIRKNTFILERLLTSSAGMSKKADDVPYIVRNNFPSKKVMSDVLSETKITKSKSYDAIRKMIILLDFYSFWVRIKIGLTDVSNDERENLPEIYCCEANARLSQCGYEELCAVNPYDYIFLCAAQNEDPLEFFRFCIGNLLE